MVGRHWATLASGSRPSRTAATNSRSWISMPSRGQPTPDTSTGLAVAVDEVVVAGHVGARVADVAEGRAERAVVVERQRQRAQRARRATAGRRTCPWRCRARGWGGPWLAQARSGTSPVWWRNRSTVWQAWCHSRWSVQDRGWPSAFVFSRRRKNVSATRCCSVSSPAAMRRWTHWWLGLKRRVWHTMAVSAGAPLGGDDRLGVGQAVGHRDLDEDVLAGLHRLDGLGGVQRRGRGEDRRRRRAGSPSASPRSSAVARDAELGGEGGGVRGVRRRRRPRRRPRRCGAGRRRACGRSPPRRPGRRSCALPCPSSTAAVLCTILLTIRSVTRFC